MLTIILLLTINILMVLFDYTLKLNTGYMIDGAG